MSNEIIVGNWSILQRRTMQRARTATKHTNRQPQLYSKPAELVAFENEYNARQAEKFARIPPECRARYTFTDKTANGLTRAIIAHLTLHGHFAGRVNTTGVYDQRRGLYRQTNARKGLADISAVIAGKAVQLEIKAGSDRPRADQLQVQREVQAAGGVYEFVHNFPEYIAIYNRLTASAR